MPSVAGRSLGTLKRAQQQAYQSGQIARLNLPSRLLLDGGVVGHQAGLKDRASPQRRLPVIVP